MQAKTIHKVARLGTLILTVMAAAFGSVVGIAGSMWGGIWVIVPITTTIFALAGAGLGAAIQFGVKMKWPEN